MIELKATDGEGNMIEVGFSEDGKESFAMFETTQKNSYETTKTGEYLQTQVEALEHIKRIIDNRLEELFVQMAA